MQTTGLDLCSPLYTIFLCSEIVMRIKEVKHMGRMLEMQLQKKITSILYLQGY